MKDNEGIFSCFPVLIFLFPEQLETLVGTSESYVICLCMMLSNEGGFYFFNLLVGG